MLIRMLLRMELNVPMCNDKDQLVDLAYPTSCAEGIIHGHHKSAWTPIMGETLTLKQKSNNLMTHFEREG